MSIENRRTLQLSEQERDRVADTLRLAEAMGGDAVTIPTAGRTIADDIIDYAQSSNVTQILIGKSQRSRWFEMLHGSVVHDLVRKAGNISVHVIAGTDIEGDPIPGKTVRTDQADALQPTPYVFALLAVAVALGVGQLVQPVLGIETVDLVFLLAVLAVAVRFGLAPSLLASVTASLCYNFFFLPPIYTFTITDPTNVAAFVFFTVVAVVVSNVAARVRTQAMTAVLRARTTESLYSFSKKLAGVGSLDDVLWASAYQTALMLKVRVVLLLPENGTIVVRGAYPPEDILDEADLAAAKWAWLNDRPAGRGSDTLPGAKRLFLPMRTGRGAIGVVGIDSDKPGPLLSPDDRRLLDALIDQSALAIERVFLVEDMDRVKRNAETERLRAALLTSISHDLKTPLAAVLGSASTLRDLSGKLDDAAKAELLATVIDESERLNRFIANLLDMTKLESGAIAPNVAPHDLREIVDTALRRASKILSQSQDRAEACARAADGGDRCGAVRAGVVQHPRQRRKICAVGHRDPRRERAGRAGRGAAGHGRRRRYPAGRARAHLRQVLPRAQRRSGSARDRARACDRARLYRGDEGLDHRDQPSRHHRRRVHHQVPDEGRRPPTGYSRMTGPQLKVLVVDDEPPIRKLLRMGLATANYAIFEAPNGKSALSLLSENPDLVILDLGLPDMDGHELLRTIRSRNEQVPIVVLSSRGDEAGKVRALDYGADDYVTKPFGMDELLARLRAALRHQLQVHGERPVFRVGDLSVDLVRRIVKVGEKDVKLSPKEYDLLRLLVQHAGKVLTHKFLLRELWDDLTDAQYLRVYVRQLRQKIEADPERPQYIQTETGIGYRLRSPD